MIPALQPCRTNVAIAASCALLAFTACGLPGVTATKDASVGPAPTPWTAPQPYTIGSTVASPGEVYSIDTSMPGDVVYLAGDMPLIITVPHGGSIERGIPERKGFPGFINKNNDDATIELALEIEKGIREITHGRRPHVIINNLARVMIDQNRGHGEDANPTTGRGGDAWKDFHERFIAGVAIPAVLKAHGSGLFIDLHGKPDGYGADIIIGYNLTSWELSNSDNHLNTGKKAYADRSSIRFLAKKLGGKVDFAALLRGNRPGHESFGSLLQSRLDVFNRTHGKKLSAVPRHDLKKPFINLSGGYNIRAYCGAKDRRFNNPYRYTMSRFICGFQLEVSREIRVQDARLRREFARSVAEAIIAFIEQNLGMRIMPPE